MGKGSKLANEVKGNSILVILESLFYNIKSKNNNNIYIELINPYKK
ncbi:hypothetical protein [Borreliella bavariensis]|nr:hypothetical protein [Borreliella bavariensis]